MSDTYTFRTLFASFSWDLQFITMTETKHDGEAPSGVASLISQFPSSACFTQFKTNVNAYFAARSNDGSATANTFNSAVPPPFDNQDEFIIAYDKTLALTQNLNNLHNTTQWTPVRSKDGSTIVTQKYLTPQWGDVTGLLPSDVEFKLADFIDKRFPSMAQYDQDINEVLDISGRLTDAQKMTAEYWESPTGSVFPPGHWNVIVVWVLRLKKMSMNDQVCDTETIKYTSGYRGIDN